LRAKITCSPCVKIGELGALTSETVITKLLRPERSLLVIIRGVHAVLGLVLIHLSVLALEVYQAEGKFRNLGFSDWL